MYNGGCPTQTLFGCPIVFLSEPQRTQYDLNFEIFGFPVRVHPAFFIMPILLGRGLIHPEINTGVGYLLVVGVFFVSILIHELGHTLAFRYYGIPSSIVLYWMGGLAIPGDGSRNLPWSRTSVPRLNSEQKIVVSLAGPVLGMLFGLLFILVVLMFGGSVRLVWMLNLIPFPVPDLRGTPLVMYPAATMLLYGGIVLNILFNLLNLVPIFPLDGGQVARELLVKADPYNGIQNSLKLSIAVGIVIALLGLSGGHQFLAIFFGFMAWSNYQTLMQSGGPRGPW